MAKSSNNFRRRKSSPPTVPAKGWIAGGIIPTFPVDEPPIGSVRGLEGTASWGYLVARGYIDQRRTV
jgi:hypothetical protein